MSAMGNPEPYDQSTPKPPKRNWKATKPFLDLKASHWVTIILTAALVFVGISQLAVYRRQAKIMKTQASIAQNANNFTVNIQRAFVFVHNVSIGHREIQSQGRTVWEFFPVWENSGITPADDVRLYAKADTLDRPLTKDYKFEWSDSSPFLLAPKGTINGVSDWIPMEDVEQKLRFTMGDFHIIEYGEARYRDIFGGQHKTQFCTDFYETIVDSKANTVSGLRWKPCDYHNCEDDRCDMR